MPRINHQLRVALAVSVALLATAGTAAAQPPGGGNGAMPGPPPFRQFDRNGDGVLTLEEFRGTPIPMGEHDAVFANIDLNGDGVVIESELLSHVPPNASQQGGRPPFSEADKNGDGALSLDEFKTMPIPEGKHELVFTDLDGNGDGVVTEAELRSQGPRTAEPRNPPPFKYLDLDGNGVLTLPELTSMPIPDGRHDEVFAGMDADGDGKVTEEELKSYKRPDHDAPPVPPQSLNEQLDPLRVTLLEPLRLVRLLDIRPGYKMLDIGAGFGLFAFPFAEAVGKSGRVLATDVDETVIQYLKEQIEQRGAPNIEAVRVSAEATDPAYSKFTYDIIFASDVWWDIRQPGAFFDGLRASLRPETGRLWILSWRLDPDFTAIELSNTEKTLDALRSPGRASLILKRLGEDSRARFASPRDAHGPVIDDRLIADLNRMLEDPTLWPDFRAQASAAGEEPLSRPELVQIATRLSSDLDAKNAVATGARPADQHALKLLRGLNRLLIQDALGSDVWERAFGPDGYSLRFWLDWVSDLRHGEEPSILAGKGFELVKEHNLLPYHRIFELKRKH